MKTIKDTPGREKETSKTHRVIFNQIQNRILDEHKPDASNASILLKVAAMDS